MIDLNIIKYDEELNTIKIISNNLNPLRIEYCGDIELQVNGEFNLLTKDNIMCFDSLNSKIFLNSLMCKSIRSQQPNEIDTVDTPIDQNKIDNSNIIALLADRIYELQERIVELEKSNQILLMR